MLDRLTRSRVLRLSRLEEVKDVLRARCRPKGKELVIRIGEGPTAADRHEARVPDLREDHCLCSKTLCSFLEASTARASFVVRSLCNGNQPKGTTLESRLATGRSSVAREPVQPTEFRTAAGHPAGRLPRRVSSERPGSQDAVDVGRDELACLGSGHPGHQ